MVANVSDVVGETGRSGPGLRVVLYLRQSDREQRLSIAQQRAECRAYAQSRGWKIVGEYVDDGKSGSKEVGKRTEFARLLDDAEQKGRKWDAILCWDTSRFGRLDSQAGAPHKLRLRRAGCWLETAKGERIDWSTSMGRLMDALRSEADNQYSLDISRNAIRGRRAVLDLGFMARPVPFGYDRAYFDGEKLVQVVPRRQVFSKPRNWHVKPQPNEQEAAVVRWLFGEWSKRDMTFMGTVTELRSRGIPSPSGTPTWSLAQIKTVLTERTYVGDLHVGNGGRTKEVHGRIGETIKANAAPALVDRSTWKLVQRKVKEREGGEWRPKTASGPLSSILKCGHCGYTLARRTYTSGGHAYCYYVCDSATKRPHLGCRQWRVCEEEVLPHITAELVDAIDFEVLRTLAAQPEKRDTAKIDRLRDQERALAAQVQRAAKNILLVDPENFQDAQKALGELRREHERTANALKLAASDVNDDRRREWVEAWDAVRSRIVRLPGKRTTHYAGALRWETFRRRLLDPESAPASGPVFDVKDFAGSTVETIQPPIDLSADALRDLLRRLSVEVHLHWAVRNPGAANPRYSLTSGVLRAQFSPTPPEAGPEAEAGEAPAGTGSAGRGRRTDVRELDLGSDESDSPARRQRPAV